MHDKSKITYVDGVVQSRGIIIFNKDSGVRKYLVIKSVNGGHWTFAKGHWLLGETEEEAARREVLEETGIKDVTLIPDFETSIQYEAYGEEKIVKFYLGEVKCDETNIDNIEVCDCKWLKYNEALELLTYDRTKKLLIEAEEFLSKNI